MSNLKLSRFALILGAAVIPAANLTGCVSVKNYYQEFFGIDKSTRESTGYYEYKDTRLANNNIVVPEGLDDPGYNKNLLFQRLM